MGRVVAKNTKRNGGKKSMEGPILVIYTFVIRDNLSDFSLDVS